jgi:hypothetical protein
MTVDGATVSLVNLTLRGGYNGLDVRGSGYVIADGVVVEDNASAAIHIGPGGTFRMREGGAYYLVPQRTVDTSVVRKPSLKEGGRE